MLHNTERVRTQEHGVSETISAVMLIAVTVSAIAIVSVFFLSQPPPEKIPALEAVISNTGNTVQILHNGGDTLQYSDFKVVIDGQAVALPSGTDTEWSSGETLTFEAPAVKTVEIVYTRNQGTATALMTSANFGGVSNSSTSMNIMAGAGAGGSISPAGAVGVVYGGSQTFSITPDAGYRITDVVVDGDSVGAVSTYSFSMVTRSHAIYAAFAKNPVITASAGPNGAITPAGEVSVSYGTSQVFMITPDAGYRVLEVTVDGNPLPQAVTQYTFANVDQDHTISATFGTNPVITASAGSGGSIYPPGNTSVMYDGSQAYTITANAGYHVLDVQVDSISQGAITYYTFTNVTTSRTIAATFAINQYTINATAGSNGAISPAGITTVTYGGNQSYTITPDTGYQVSDVVIDSVSIGPLTNYTFSNIAANHTIAATFAINQYSINATAGPNGAISPSGITTVNYGGSQTYAITANTGYHVLDVQVDSVSQGAITNYTFTNVVANHTIAATFAINQYTINATAGSNGVILPSEITTVNYGGSQAYAITANTGYHILDVQVDSVSQGAITNYTFTNVVANHTIAATFAINQYSINATAGSNGSISPSGITTVNYGGSQAYNITPNTGYHVLNVVVDSVSQGPLTNYTFTNVVANHTIAATFAINQYTINATAGSNGSISPSGITTVNYGGSQAYNLTPNTGYHVLDVVVDSVSQGAITNYTFTNVVANHTIAATFAINQYTINATAGPNGAITPSGIATVNYGGNQAYTITPNTGYNVLDVVVDSVSQGPLTNYTFTNVVANHTIAATFRMTPPVANFTATPLSGGVPLMVTFTDLSTNNPSSWLWNFGDPVNTTSTERNPTHIYSLPGNYSVELTATNDGGSNKTVRQGYIFTYYPAVANFTGTPTLGSYGLSGLTVQFSDHSTGGVSSWNWDFGDGSYSGANTQQNPGHTYAVGRYSVNLTVANTFSSSYLRRENYINVTPNPPTSDFETYDNDVDMNPLNQGFAPLSVFFYDLSSDVPTSWTWNFGDGNVTTITKDVSHEYGDIYHTFTNAGTYNVSLTANNAWGSDTSYKTITVTALTITASSGPNGAVTPSGVTTVNYGATPTYTITPDVGYHVADVLVDGSSVGAVTSYTFPPVTTNKTLSATFAINTYTVTSSVASGQGTISPLGTATYNYGATPTYTITKNATYSIGDVLVDGSSVGAVSSYTFPTLAANHTISASFTKNPSVQIYYQPFNTNTGWPYDTWTRSSATYVTLSTTLRNGTSGYSVRDALNAYFGRTIPTTGYDEIYVRYTWATAGLTGSQYAIAQDSTSGTYTEFARQTGNLPSLTIVNVSRPDAGDNANYALRWRIYASQTSDYLYVDDVQVFGTPI